MIHVDWLKTMARDGLFYGSFIAMIVILLNWFTG